MSRITEIIAVCKGASHQWVFQWCNRFALLFWNSSLGHPVLRVWGWSENSCLETSHLHVRSVFVRLKRPRIRGFCPAPCPPVWNPVPRRMVLSTSQQVALAFTAVLLMFVVLPRLFGVSGGGTVRENAFDPHYPRKGEVRLDRPVKDKLVPFSARRILLVLHRMRRKLDIWQFLVVPRPLKDNIRFMPHPRVYYCFSMHARTKLETKIKPQFTALIFPPYGPAAALFLAWWGPELRRYLGGPNCNEEIPDPLVY